MLIDGVKYRKLVSLGDFSNEAIEASAVVGPGESPDAVLQDLKAWVEARLSDRRSEESLGHKIADSQYALDRLNGQIEDAKARFELAKAFLKKHGVELDTRDIPF